MREESEVKEKSEKREKRGKKVGKGEKGRNILSLFCFLFYEYLPCLGKGKGKSNRK